MPLSRFSRRPLSLIVTPWRPDAVENSKRSAAILLVGDPEKETVIPAKVLSLLYGLTPAEARLALALLNGNSLAEAAELHGTSELTARTRSRLSFRRPTQDGRPNSYDSLQVFNYRVPYQAAG
jgi:hypothetical protein